MSDHDTARAQLDAQQHTQERRSAVRVVAGAARDTTDARSLLDMLGLSLDDVRAARRPRVAAAVPPAKTKKRSAA